MPELEAPEAHHANVQSVAAQRPDVVWINGTFGAGKSSVVAELVALDPSLVAVDPEEVGYLLRDVLPVPTDDFRDLPAWRRLVAATIVEVLHARRGDDTPVNTVVVGMTLDDPVHRGEVFGGLAAAGTQVAEVVLTAAKDLIADRIRAQVLHPEDPARDEASRRWRLARLEQTTHRLEQLPGEVPRIDTGAMTAAAAARRVHAETTSSHRCSPRA
ncbi:AAA family ATPase [Euzebya rosea]|uniref:AAA family ATPase n=1 Tax=Euzebya rosea TaxID=2052804 RepID=UPI000D3E8E74|nr:AAA family ATPase [Euzebya rosea]